jgi:hypothetical protein
MIARFSVILQYPSRFYSPRSSSNFAGGNAAGGLLLWFSALQKQQGGSRGRVGDICIPDLFR